MMIMFDDDDDDEEEEEEERLCHLFFCFIYDVLVIGRVGKHVIPRTEELFVWIPMLVYHVIMKL